MCQVVVIFEALNSAAVCIYIFFIQIPSTPHRNIPTIGVDKGTTVMPVVGR